MPSALEPFENHPVVRSEVKILKAGDGLSASLDVEPLAFAIGERVVYIVEVDTADVDFKRLSAASGERKRVHAQPVMRIVRTTDPDVLRVLEANDNEVREAVRAKEARQAAEAKAEQDAAMGVQEPLDGATGPTGEDEWEDGDGEA